MHLFYATHIIMAEGQPSDFTKLYKLLLNFQSDAEPGQDTIPIHLHWRHNETAVTVNKVANLPLTSWASFHETLIALCNQMMPLIDDLYFSLDEKQLPDKTDKDIIIDCTLSKKRTKRLATQKELLEYIINKTKQILTKDNFSLIQIYYEPDNTCYIWYPTMINKDIYVDYKTLMNVLIENFPYKVGDFNITVLKSCAHLLSLTKITETVNICLELVPLPTITDEESFKHKVIEKTTEIQYLKIAEAEAYEIYKNFNAMYTKVPPENKKAIDTFFDDMEPLLKARHDYYKNQVNMAQMALQYLKEQHRHMMVQKIETHNT
jgi:hypothetical protein